MKKVRLHEVLKRLIAEKQVSAREVARSTGIAQSTLTSMMSGRGMHKPEQILALAQFFGCSMEYLLFGEDVRPPTLEEVLTEPVFSGWLRVRIERAIPDRRRFSAKKSEKGDT